MNKNTPCVAIGSFFLPKARRRRALWRVTFRIAARKSAISRLVSTAMGTTMAGVASQIGVLLMNILFGAINLI